MNIYQIHDRKKTKLNLAKMQDMIREIVVETPGVIP